jgi:hypothetical protein
MEVRTYQRNTLEARLREVRVAEVVPIEHTLGVVFGEVVCGENRLDLRMLAAPFVPMVAALPAVPSMLLPDPFTCTEPRGCVDVLSGTPCQCLVIENGVAGLVSPVIALNRAASDERSGGAITRSAVRCSLTIADRSTTNIILTTSDSEIIRSSYFMKVTPLA